MRLKRGKELLLAFVTGAVSIVLTYASEKSADALTCRSPTFSNGRLDTEIVVQCWTEWHFPYSSCEFTVKGLSTERKTYREIDHETLPTTPGLFIVHCILHIPLAGLNPGVYQLEVEAMMYRGTSTKGKILPVSTELKAPLSLSLPEVSLAGDCPKWSTTDDTDYVSWTNASCRCELTSLGFPPGQAQWYSSSGEPMDSVRSADGSATITLSATDSATEFQCRAESILNHTQPRQVIYQPNRAAPVPNPTTLKNKENSGGDNNTLATGLGLGLGIGLIIAIIIIVGFVVISFRRKGMAADRRGHSGTNYSLPEPPSPLRNNYLSMRTLDKYANFVFRWVFPWRHHILFAPNPDEGHYDTVMEVSGITPSSTASPRHAQSDAAGDMQVRDNGSYAYIVPSQDQPLYNEVGTEVKQVHEYMEPIPDPALQDTENTDVKRV